jgi:GNAT superfamily N-acetyltransferase
MSRPPSRRCSNSNPDFVDASEGLTGKRQYGLDEIGLHLWQESVRENSTFLVIRLRATTEVVGCAAMLVPNPDDQLPWVGLLLIDADRQRRGLGTEVVNAIEDFLTGAGWNRVRLNVLTALPGPRRFWTLEERSRLSVLAYNVDTASALPPRRMRRARAHTAGR